MTAFDPLRTLRSDLCSYETRAAIAELEKGASMRPPEPNRASAPAHTADGAASIAQRTGSPCQPERLRAVECG
jgi:hypothetical protein